MFPLYHIILLPNWRLCPQTPSGGLCPPPTPPPAGISIVCRHMYPLSKKNFITHLIPDMGGDRDAPAKLRDR